MLENATNFNYAYSSSFADITGAGSIAMAMTITEGKVNTSYQMAFDVNSRASEAGAIAIASPQNATINLRAETWNSISPYLDFSQKFINYTDTRLVKLGSIANDGIFSVAGNTVDINDINPLTYADFTAVPLTF